MLLRTSSMYLQTQRMLASRQLSFERYQLFMKRLIPEEWTFFRPLNKPQLQYKGCPPFLFTLKLIEFGPSVLPIELPCRAGCGNTQGHWTLSAS
jgi:hypothetical protein